MKNNIYCVACESSTSGTVEWFFSLSKADAKYNELVADQDLNTDTITRFNMVVDSSLTFDEITTRVDAAMWQSLYKPVRVRFGSDGVNLHNKHLSAMAA